MPLVAEKDEVQNDPFAEPQGAPGWYAQPGNKLGGTVVSRSTRNLTPEQKAKGRRDYEVLTVKVGPTTLFKEGDRESTGPVGSADAPNTVIPEGTLVALHCEATYLRNMVEKYNPTMGPGWEVATMYEGKKVPQDGGNATHVYPNRVRAPQPPADADRSEQNTFA